MTSNEFFSPFVLSVVCMIGKEALVVLANLSRLMAAKMEETILHVQASVNSWIGIAFAILYFHIIRGACLPSPLWDRDPNLESCSGLGLAQ